MTFDPSLPQEPTTPSLSVIVRDGEARVDSRLLAEPIGVSHRSLFRLLTEHEPDFAGIATVRFEIAPSKARGAGGDGVRFAMLTEDQSYLLLAYSKNTPQARGLKQQLVMAFRSARERLEGRVSINRAEYEHAMQVERDAAVSKALGGFGGKLMRKRRAEKPLYEQAINALRLSLQLTLPWPKE